MANRNFLGTARGGLGPDQWGKDAAAVWVKYRAGGKKHPSKGGEPLPSWFFTGLSHVSSWPIQGSSYLQLSTSSWTPARQKSCSTSISMPKFIYKSGPFRNLPQQRETHRTNVFNVCGSPLCRGLQLPFISTACSLKKPLSLPIWSVLQFWTMNWKFWDESGLPNEWEWFPSVFMKLWVDLCESLLVLQ